MYGLPSGAYIYAKMGGRVAGGVGVRYLTSDICEMKRLYVYEEYRYQGIASLLCSKIISISKDLSYSCMRLDTVSKLVEANSLYDKLGFKDIPKHYDNPDTVRYMELTYNLELYYLFDKFMNTLILILAFLFLFGILGSIIPIIPGPPISYLGVLIIHLFTPTEFSNAILWIGAIVGFVLFWIITFRYGAENLVEKVFYWSFIGHYRLIFSSYRYNNRPFVGAFLGAIYEIGNDNMRALKVAFGSLLGFISGAFLKIALSITLLFILFCMFV